MGNAQLDELLQFIKERNGIGDKTRLATAIKDKFDLTLDRKIYYCKDFAIRFSQSSKRTMSNTVLSLSALQKYDDRPVISCAVLPDENFLLLCNTTCLKKISHSSQQLRVDNIKGSFNHSDIMKNVAGIDNVPENFQELFAIHSAFTFEENLERLVEATNGIVAHGHRFELTPEKEKYLLESPIRAEQFLSSEFYSILDRDLSARVEKVKNEIVIAAFIDNVNIKGNIIEYLITSDGGATRELLIDALTNDKPIPQIKNSHDFGDYNVSYEKYETKTDIKTKVLFLNSNPKAYNIDKLLEFLSTEKSVYLLYFVGVNSNKEITTFLCPVFSAKLLEATRVIPHWAGRNSRGVAQFNGEEIKGIINNKYSKIDIKRSKEYLDAILKL